MNFVIPMAGKGQRFKDANYDKPKMLLVAFGKTLLEWSVDSLPLDLCSKLIFIGLEDDFRKFPEIENLISRKYKDLAEIELVKLKSPTRGQAETVILSKDHWDLEKDLLIFNIDTYFTSKTLKNNLLREDIDGVIGSFNDNTDSFKYSYAKINKRELVELVAEKVHISDNALTGLYHFKKPSDFISTAKFHIENDLKNKGEFYIAPMYNELISKGRKIILDKSSEIHILGTPEEYEHFLSLNIEE